MDVPANLRTRDDCYVLQVRGDSMIEDGILDGDWIVVEPRDSASNGQVVVALVDGSEATVKRLLQRPGEVVLIPANGSMAPMHLAPHRVSIQGVVVGQMRSYR
jgi:repressor LexA